VLPDQDFVQMARADKNNSNQLLQTRCTIGAKGPKLEQVNQSPLHHRHRQGTFAVDR
jgi:hypothetical protein